MKKFVYLLAVFSLSIPTFSLASSVASQSQCPVLKSYTQADFEKAFLNNNHNKGVFVKLEKNNKTYYLYGTIHNTKLENINLGEDVIKAINNATGVAVETDISNPATNEKLKDTKKIQLSKDVKKLFTKLEKRYCINDEKYNNASSIEKAYYLAMYANAVNGYFFGFGADSIIINMAKKLNKPITSLELPQEQQAMLSNYDNAVVRDILQSVDSQAVVKQVETIDKAWINGDVVALSAMREGYKDKGVTYVNNLMSERRDYKLAQNIDAFYQTHDNGLAAIGVMHLVGEHNVIDYLAKQGYRITYLYPPKAPNLNSP